MHTGKFLYLIDGVKMSNRELSDVIGNTARTLRKFKSSHKPFITKEGGKLLGTSEAILEAEKYKKSSFRTLGNVIQTMINSGSLELRYKKNLISGFGRMYGSLKCFVCKRHF